MILSANRSIAGLPHLSTFLADRPDAVAGWGRKSSGRRAQWLARLLRRPLALLEDGFIRSVERGLPTLSLLVDDIGVYYDASRPSRMEAAIARGAGDGEAVRALALANAWRAHSISKYNHAPDYAGFLPDPYVLVVDQVVGDLSVSGGLAAGGDFARMLDAALIENPGAAIVVKTHPDIFTKAKEGYFPSTPSHDDRIFVTGEDCHGPSLIRGASAIYCVTSLIGFEAILWNKPVRCFGMPFYAGWDITQDELKRPFRRHPARPEDIVHAALVELARYVNPADGSRWEIEDVIGYVARERAALLRRQQMPSET